MRVAGVSLERNVYFLCLGSYHVQLRTLRDRDAMVLEPGYSPAEVIAK